MLNVRLRAKGGTVFLPVSSEENQKAADFLSAQGITHAWLRASDSYEEGVWKDFETLEDMTFTNWHPDEPNDGDRTHGGEDYAYMRSSTYGSGYWNDYYYGGWNKVRILCELPSPLK